MFSLKFGSVISEQKWLNLDLFTHVHVSRYFALSNYFQIMVSEKIF